MEINGNLDGIHHRPLRNRRVNIFAFDFNLRLRRIKGFVLQLTKWPAVNGVGNISPEVRNVKVISTGSNFFIRSQTNPDFTMLNFWMGH